MRDQADQLRQLVRDTVKDQPALEPGVPLIVLSGGKEGLGVSTVAVQLVQELAALGKQTVLVDANPLQPDLASRLGVDSQTGLGDVLNGSRSAVEVLRPLNRSVRVLPGRWTPDSPPELNREAMRRLLLELRSMNNHADMIIADAGNGMSPWVQHLWKAASQILLLTTPDSTAVMDSYATIKLAPWGDVDGKLRLVVNQCDTHETANQIGERFAATCRKFLGISLLEPTFVAGQPNSGEQEFVPLKSTQEETRYQKSVRLLAAELISGSLVLETTSIRKPLADTAPELIANEENSIEISN